MADTKRQREIDTLLHHLRVKEKELAWRPSIYSFAISEINRSHEFIRELACQFSDFTKVSWVAKQTLAKIADFLGMTVDELADNECQSRRVPAPQPDPRQGSRFGRHR